MKRLFCRLLISVAICLTLASPSRSSITYAANSGCDGPYCWISGEITGWENGGFIISEWKRCYTDETATTQICQSVIDYWYPWIP